MIVSICSGKGSPGASATALAMTLCWPVPVLLVEADPAGASMVAGYAAGVDVGDRGLTGVRVAARRSSMAEAIWANVVTVGENRWLLPGVDTVRQAAAVDYAAVGSTIARLGVDVIVDAGRIPSPVPHHGLWAAADVVLVAMRSTLPAVRAAQAAAAAVRESIGPADSTAAAAPLLSSVIIGAGRPYSDRDIRAAMADIAPVVGTFAWDMAAAGALVDALPTPRRIESTPLMRSATTFTQSLIESYLAHAGPEQPEAESARPASHLANASEHVSQVSDGAAPAPAHRLPAAAVTLQPSPAATVATVRAGGAS